MEQTEERAPAENYWAEAVAERIALTIPPSLRRDWHSRRRWRLSMPECKRKGRAQLMRRR